MKHNYLFLIGAAKSATTSVAAMLSSHPDVVVASTKEPCFFTDFSGMEWTGPGSTAFSTRLVRSFEDYDAGFSGKPNALWRVDASTDYFSCPASPQRIADFAASNRVGRVVVMAILRDPVQRSISEYQHTLRDGFETETLAVSLELETFRREAGYQPLFWHVERSRYASHIRRWRSTSLNPHLLAYDAIGRDESFMANVFDLLDLKIVDRVPTAEVRNRSYTYKSPFVGRVMRNRAVLGAARSVVPKKLRSGFKDSVLRFAGARYVPEPSEIARLRQSLQSEIDACLRDPAIPTDGWTLSTA